MLVSEYIIDFLHKQGIKKVFIITGGAIAFVVDSFHKRDDIEYVCMAHEQAAAMAADAYARMGPGIGATMVTSGPGATNLITGICCSWFDSIPTIHISGQVNTFEQKKETGVRQIGFQETDIVGIVKPITKLAEQLDKPENIRYLLEKAVYFAKEGRPGPVLVDIPQNFQRVHIDPKKLRKYSAPHSKSKNNLSISFKEIKKLIEKSKRPIILLGFGIRIAHAEKETIELLKKLRIPVVTSWSALDLLPKNHPYLVGEIGVYGNRGANFAIQNSDLLISIGSRLDTRQTGGRPETFARNAKKIVVDIDPHELNKNRLKIDVKIKSDAKDFIQYFLSKINLIKIPNNKKWLDQCIIWKQKYPSVQKKYYKKKQFVDPYVFTETLSELLKNDAIIIPDDGANLSWTMQSFKVKKGQRLFSAFGNSPMGYALPASIGASLAQKNRQIICIDGDGSIQINIQDLQTIIYHKLPIKIFILNNKGYGIIKQFQEMYLDSRFEATGKGYSAPDFIKIAKAYSIDCSSIKNHKDMRKKIKDVLKNKGPVICDVNIEPNQKIIPKLEFGKPIEELSPLLNEKEFLSNMIVPPLHHKEIKSAGV